MARTFYVKISSKGKHPINWIKEVDDKIHFEFQEALVELGELCAQRMKTLLGLSGYRLNTLAEAIDSRVLDSVGGVRLGIGEVIKLPFYWELFNDGFKPGASNSLVPLGAFYDGAPDSTKSGGKWIVGQGGYTFFDDNNTKRPVKPIDYIGISAEELRVNIIKQINKLNKELEKASK